MKYTLIFTLIGLSLNASALSCRGSQLRFNIVNGRMVGVQAQDAKIAKSLSASFGLLGPTASNSAEMPVYYQGEFRSHSPYTGSWTLSLNPATKSAEFFYDDYDGDMRSFGMTCR